MDYDHVKHLVRNSIGLEKTQSGFNLISFSIYDGDIELYREGTLCHTLSKEVTGKFEGREFIIIDGNNTFKMLIFKQYIE